MPKKKTKVAVVDDKQTNRNFLLDKLRDKPNIMVVFSASNGQEFLDRMKEANPKPDVVFMDIDMPVMDGIEAVEAASVVYPDTRFLMLTVFDDEDKIFDAIKAGAVGYLLKEESADRLVQAVEEVIAYGGAPMSPRVARKSLQMLSNQKTGKKGKEESQLSDREMQILHGLVDGKDYRQIAAELFLSPQTVRTHISNIYKKLHVNNKAQAIKIAMKKSWFGVF